MDLLEGVFFERVIFNQKELPIVGLLFMDEGAGRDCFSQLVFGLEQSAEAGGRYVLDLDDRLKLSFVAEESGGYTLYVMNLDSMSTDDPAYLVTRVETSGVLKEFFAGPHHHYFLDGFVRAPDYPGFGGFRPLTGVPAVVKNNIHVQARSALPPDCPELWIDGQHRRHSG